MVRVHVHAGVLCYCCKLPLRLLCHYCIACSALLCHFMIPPVSVWVDAVSWIHVPTPDAACPAAENIVSPYWLLCESQAVSVPCIRCLGVLSGSQQIRTMLAWRRQKVVCFAWPLFGVRIFSMHASSACPKATVLQRQQVRIGCCAGRAGLEGCCPGLVTHMWLRAPPRLI